MHINWYIVIPNLDAFDLAIYKRSDFLVESIIFRLFVRCVRFFFTIWHFCKAFLYISCMEFSMLHRNGIDFVRRNYMSVYWSRNKYQLKCNVCSGNLGSFLLRGLIFDRHILFSFKRLSSNKFKLNALRAM